MLLKPCKENGISTTCTSTVGETAGFLVAINSINQPKNVKLQLPSARCVAVFGTVGTCCPVGDLVQSENRCCCGFLGPENDTTKRATTGETHALSRRVVEIGKNDEEK